MKEKKGLRELRILIFFDYNKRIREKEKLKILKESYIQILSLFYYQIINKLNYSNKKKNHQ